MNILINDPGGSVLSHYWYGKTLAMIGSYVKVKFCASACFWVLAVIPLSHICVYRDAWFGYHTGAQRKDGSEDTTTMYWQRGRDLIAQGKYTQC